MEKKKKCKCHHRNYSSSDEEEQKQSIKINIDCNRNDVDKEYHRPNHHDVNPKYIICCKGEIGKDGPIGPQGLKGDTGPKGDTGAQGDTGLQGITGPKGDTGTQGDTGPKGDTGTQGDTGPKGDTGTQGDTGPKGDTGAQGDTGPQGNTGPIGPPGENAAIASIFVWSSLQQLNRLNTSFQYVEFEKTPIGPNGFGWTNNSRPTYTHSTDFIVPTSGYYLMTYKLDVRSGGGSSPSSSTNCATVLTQNGIEIDGSATLVEAPESNHIYTISNTVLASLNANDNISLMFWSEDIGTKIGDPTFLTGTLPNGTTPNEAIASIVFTRIYES